MEALADAALKRELARLEARLVELRAMPSWADALGVVPLVFDRSEDPVLFELGVELAKRVTTYRGGLPISRVTIARTAEGKMHLQARSEVWSGFALLSPSVLLEEWAAACKTVAGRRARAEELAGTDGAAAESGR